MSDEKSFQYVKIMLPLFPAVVNNPVKQKLKVEFISGVIPRGAHGGGAPLLKHLLILGGSVP